MPFIDRLAGLRTALADADLTAVAVVPGPNLYYLTGLPFFTPSDRPKALFIARQGEPVMVTPGLEAPSLGETAAGWTIFTYDDVGGPAAAFRDAVAHLNLSGARVGVEARRCRFIETELMSATAPGPLLVAADDTFAALRMTKQASELDHMRRAVVIAQTAMEALHPAIRPGVSEAELERRLRLHLLKAGSDYDLPFPPIVLAGPNGAEPHGSPGTRPLAAGDLVTIDWGAATGHYFSDITRTYAVGGAPVDARLTEAYEAVRAANAAGRAACRPGVSAAAVDRATRQVIADAGLGEYFIHRTGHGLGLEIHEEPDLKEGSEVVLQPGMTFTVEPGVYLPGCGGVRIEDDMVITATGAETLTGLPRELITLG